MRAGIHPPKCAVRVSKGTLHHIEIEPAANGGFTITHHCRPTAGHTKGTMFSGLDMHAPETKVHMFEKREHAELTAHLAEALALRTSQKSRRSVPGGPGRGG
jgi:hypothetical protein